MTWINDNPTQRRYPGWLETAAGLLQIQENIRHLAGQSVGQDSIVIGTPLSWEDWVESVHATKFDQVKSASPTDITELFRNLIEYELRSKEGFAIPDESTFRMGIERIGVSPRQNLGDISFFRDSELNGRLRLAAIFSGATGGFITITPDGFVAINSDTAEYELDVPNGVINVSGDYRRGGTIIADWLETLGTPNVVSITGDAVVDGYSASSTLATGTAPWAMTSTTSCPNVSSFLFEGYSWHPGLQIYGNASYAATDSDIVSGTLDRVGTWEITANLSVSTDLPDEGLTVQCKLKDGSGTQIGDTAEFTAKKIVFGGVESSTEQNVSVFGTYVSALGNETIKATVAVPTGSGAFAEATITMIWQGP